MQQIEKIEFRQSRDFGEIFNVTVKFIKSNFKFLLKCLLLYGGPFILLSSLGSGIYQSNLISSINPNKYSPNFFGQVYNLTYFLTILGSILSWLIILGLVFEYMLLYSEKGPNNYTMEEVGKNLWRNAGKYLGTFLATVILLVVAVVIIGIFAYFIFNISKILGVLIVFFLIIGLLMIFPPLSFWSSAIYLNKRTEQNGVFETFIRTKNLMKDNFWWTWLIFFCGTMIIFILSMVFAIPQGILTMMMTFSSMKGETSSTMNAIFLATSTLGNFFSMLIYSFLLVMVVMHYFNLEERKEGKSLLEKIDSIGDPKQ